MAETRPTGEQLRFVSSKTGEWILDTYMEAMEIGDRTVYDLLGDLFDPAASGAFRSDNFEFRLDPATDKFQVRVGQFAGPSTGWTDVTYLFGQRGVFNSSNTYQNFDIVTVAAKDVYIVTGLSAGATYANEAAFIASSNTTRIVDVSEAKDWASKTDGQISSTDYSAKAYAIGGTGVTTTSGKGAAKEWATTTGAAVDTSEYSAKEYAIGTAATTGGSAKSWSQDTNQVNGAGTNDRSAKNWAQGSSMTGATLGGSAKDWAQTTGATVDGTNYAAKEWALGTTVGDGSAKDWATQAEDSAVDGSGYSSLHHSAKSAASATAAASSSGTAATQATNSSTSATASAASATASATSATASDTAKTASETAKTAAETAQTAAETAKTAAEAALDNFDDTFLGAKSSDPTLDNDGDALTAGDMYFNTTVNNLKVYNGSAWQVAALSSATVVEKNTGTGAAYMPAGTTAQRPTGVSGYLRFNASLGQFEGYGASSWGSIGGAGYFIGSGTTHGDLQNGKKDLFRVNNTNMDVSTTIETSTNASVAGPLDVDSGVVLDCQGTCVII